MTFLRIILEKQFNNQHDGLILLSDMITRTVSLTVALYLYSSDNDAIE
jgi:hypothetical protein